MPTTTPRRSRKMHLHMHRMRKVDTISGNVRAHPTSSKTQLTSRTTQQVLLPTNTTRTACFYRNKPKEDQTVPACFRSRADAAVCTCRPPQAWKGRKRRANGGICTAGGFISVQASVRPQFDQCPEEGCATRINLIKEKQTGKLKGRTVADGRSQWKVRQVRDCIAHRVHGRTDGNHRR